MVIENKVLLKNKKKDFKQKNIFTLQDNKLTEVLKRVTMLLIGMSKILIQ